MLLVTTGTVHFQVEVALLAHQEPFHSQQETVANVPKDSAVEQDQPSVRLVLSVMYQ